MTLKVFSMRWFCFSFALVPLTASLRKDGVGEGPFYQNEIDIDQKLSSPASSKYQSSLQNWGIGKKPGTSHTLTHLSTVSVCWVHAILSEARWRAPGSTLGTEPRCCQWDAPSEPPALHRPSHPSVAPASPEAAKASLGFQNLLAPSAAELSPKLWKDTHHVADSDRWGRVRVA